MVGCNVRPVRLAVATALIVVFTEAALASSGGTSLRVTVRTSPGAPTRVTTLRCDPSGGTVTQPARACRRLLAAGRGIFAPTPPGTACTMIYGGPQEALVTGTLRGVKVWARFRRRDGCEIARWNRVGFLLGARPA
jgi:Subtilisin inhibitor-like